jgi:hypothetical protein
MPWRLSYLLWLVVLLGAVSSVAFSTSYQLVAWFRCVSRHAGSTHGAACAAQRRLARAGVAASVRPAAQAASWPRGA